MAQSSSRSIVPLPSLSNTANAESSSALVGPLLFMLFAADGGCGARPPSIAPHLEHFPNL
eukprot:4512185-Prymnesium_polylepis.1